MPTVKNSEFIASTSDGLQNTPVNKRIADIQQSSSRPSLLDSPFKLLNSMDKTFDKFSEQTLNTIDQKLKEFKEELVKDLRENIIIDNKLHEICERITILENRSSEIESMRVEIRDLKSKLRQQENYPVSTELNTNMTVMSDHDRSHDLDLKPLPASDKTSDNMITIGEFFAHKNVFITGGRGFLGTDLIEALLDASPDIGNIYVLVRGVRVLIFSELLKERLFPKYDIAKVKLVVGELNEVNFNLSDDNMNELIERVNIIYHNEATTEFNSHLFEDVTIDLTNTMRTKYLANEFNLQLRTVIQTNLTGTMRTIELAKRVKNLTAYIYCSTAFCNSNNRGLIIEEVYKSKYDPHEMMKMAADDSQWVDFTEKKCKQYIGDHFNAYTFTKNLSENLLMMEMKGLPTAVVRPSIVYGTYDKPTPDMEGNPNYEHLGFLFVTEFIKGYLRTIRGRSSAVIDIIPRDFVINACLTMGWYVGTRHLETPEVIHCTSGEVNPLTLSEFREHINACIRQNFPNTPSWFLHMAKLRNGWRYNLYFYLFKLLPLCALMTSKQQFRMLNMFRRIFNLGAEDFDFTLISDFRYDLTNALRIINRMHETDRKRYNFDASRCNWLELLDRTILGERSFLFLEQSQVPYDSSFTVIFVVLCITFSVICVPLLGFTIGLPLSLLVFGFLVWL